MKQSAAYMLAASGLCALLLSGCGDAGRTDADRTTPEPVHTPILAEPVHPEVEELLPELSAPETPDVRDGIVEDRDGILTEEDNPGGRDNETDRLPDSGSGAGTDSGKTGAGNQAANNGGMEKGTGPVAGTRR